jgi:hypothetical protein
MKPTWRDEHEGSGRLWRAAAKSAPLLSGSVVTAKVLRCLRPRARGGHVVVALGIRDWWYWRRIDRRIVADHQRSVSDSLGLLVAARAPVLVTLRSPSEEEQAPDLSTGVAGLVVPGWRLILAGVAAAPRTALASAARTGLQLAGAGRYGKFWWIEVACTDGTRRERVMLLGSHLRLLPAKDGPGSQGIPAGACELDRPVR